MNTLLDQFREAIKDQPFSLDLEAKAISDLVIHDPDVFSMCKATVDQVYWLDSKRRKNVKLQVVIFDHNGKVDLSLHGTGGTTGSNRISYHENRNQFLAAFAWAF